MNGVFNTAEEVSAEVKTRLEKITTANGFHTDIGTNVRMGRSKFPEEHELPCIQVLEAEDVVTADSGKTRSTTVTIDTTFVVDAWCTCDPNQPNIAAHQMIKDIMKVIFAGNRNFDNQVPEVRYIGRDFAARADGAGFVQARVEFVVNYASRLEMP